MLRFEQLETRHSAGKSSLAAISGEGLWLRQNLPKGHYVLHANAINPTNMTLERVIVFQLEENNRFVSRLDAEKAVLGNQVWQLSNVSITGPDKPLERQKGLNIPTDMTQENIQDSYAKPKQCRSGRCRDLLTYSKKPVFRD